MNTALVIIIFVVGLLLAVFLHELGHFITAKRAGVKIEEFGIGIPPRIFGIQRGETIYSVNAIPIGAFVKSVGENDPTVHRSLASKGPWTRLLVYAAGPLANIFLAFILLSIFFMLPSGVIVANGVMIHSITESSPAEEAGIKPGDIILEACGESIHKWGDIQNIINSSEEGEEISLILQRDGNQEEISLKPEFDPELQRRTIGVLLCWNIVTQVDKGSPAYEAGIMHGDTILSINEQPVYNNESMSQGLSSIEDGKEMHLTLLRGHETISVSLTKEPGFFQQTMGLVVRWVEGTHIEQSRPPLWKAVYLGGDFIIHMPSMIVNAAPLIKEDPGKALVGPIGAGQLTIEFVKSFGLSNILFMSGFISIAIAIFNFLPVPPLDGGGMLIALIEGVKRGKRLSPRSVKLAYTIGTTFLIALMVLVTFNDILRLIRGGSFGL